MNGSKVRRSQWNNAANAARYHAFTQSHSIYRDTSRDLIREVSLDNDASVVDLACGTGVTTAELLSSLGPAGRVTAIDASEVMLAQGRKVIKDSRVSWVHAFVEDSVNNVDGPVDAIVCNAAIWQANVGATFAAAHTLLRREGRFAFNVGDRMLCAPRQGNHDAEHADLTLVMRSIAAKRYGWAPPDAAAPESTQQLSKDSVRRALSDAGFRSVEIGYLEYHQSPEMFRAWLAVPIFTEHHLPGLTYRKRMHVLDEAWELVGVSEASRSGWVSFVATR